MYTYEAYREAIKDRIPKITSLLEERREAEEERREAEYDALRAYLELQGEEPDGYLSFSPIADFDVFSFPGCDCLRELGPIEDFVFTELIVKINGKIVSPHFAFVKDQLVIDPTFGQFKFLDRVIPQNPDLFVDRIFFGTIQQAKEQLGVEYIKP